MFRLMTTTALALVLAPVPEFADVPEIASPAITQAQDQGYTVTEIKRTWLGRILITAESATQLREIVLNRKTGQILHDRTYPQQRSSGGERTAPSSLSAPVGVKQPLAGPTPKDPTSTSPAAKPEPSKPARPGGEANGDQGKDRAPGGGTPRGG